MSGYTSGKISHDPEPYEHQHDGCDYNGSRYSFRADDGCECAPRPEFDHHNPILVAYREYDERNAKVFRTWASTMHGWSWDRFNFTPTPEQVAHARRVLEKLAALKDESHV
jgi:hypothetical protein